MKTVSVDKFIPHIAPQADGCPDFVIRQAVVGAVAEACRRTGCLRTSSMYFTEPGSSEIELLMSYDLKPEKIRHVFLDGVELQDARTDDLSWYFGGMDWRKSKGVPRFYTFEKPNTLQLYPVPKRSHEVRVECSISVKRDINQIPSVFYEDHLDVIIQGALSRIYRVAGQAYTNVRLADECAVKFLLGCKHMLEEVSLGFTKQSGHVFFKRIV